MVNTDATNWEPKTRETEGRTDGSETNAGSQGRFDGNSSELGSIGERAVGASWEEANKDTNGGGYHGGMLDQMIADCEDRLAEAEACLEWYENVRQRELKRRENLRKLEKMRDKELEEQKQKTQSPTE